MAAGKRVNAGKAQPEPARKNLTVQRPKLGQNFLSDEAAAIRIVKALGDTSTRTVLEIGPGKGVLTGLLAQGASRLIAIELDRVLAAQLRMNFSTYPNVEIIEGDVLSIDLETVFRRRPGPLSLMEPPSLERVRVIGNIPYYITSGILLHLFTFHRVIESVVIMVQREVADRVAAKPGTSEYGLLSATAQLYAQVENLFTLPPEAFSPPPKVHSSVLRLTMDPQIEKLQVEEKSFIEYLTLSFAQKRKTLVNNLKTRYEDGAIRLALKEAGVRADARAESLSLDKAAAIFRHLTAGGTMSGTSL
ncbi:MAG TPA: 16S rRNA (adenine(1518)-N(6)/adenine(1519)-N(6))-dimethyltransferase RsmA [Terriglobales bacterium]|nr:16S rRNA (adenine(1518)-N(6)/adenine(1519)-N(6))-dimethyltransferase RsmA [Terriglobales bacterium]